MFDRNKSIFFDAPTLAPIAEDHHNHVLDTSVKLQWDVNKSRDYGMLLLLDVDGREDEVKYSCRITRLEDCATGQLIFEVQRLGEVYVNQTVPDLLADRLAYESGKVFFPLLVRLDEEGGINKVENHTEIVARWHAIKQHIAMYYEGAFVDNYLRQMETLILSEDVVLNAFRNDWLLHIFFHPLYKNYSMQASTVIRYAPILPSTMLAYEIKDELMPTINQFGALSVEQKGSLRIETDTYDTDSCLGDYAGVYALHPLQKHLIAFQGTWSFQGMGEEKKTTVRLFYLPAEGTSFDHDFVQDYSNVSLVNMDNVTIEPDRREGNFFKRWFNK